MRRRIRQSKRRTAEGNLSAAPARSSMRRNFIPVALRVARTELESAQLEKKRMTALSEKNRVVSKAYSQMLSRYWLAVRAGVCLCMLPLLLRVFSLRVLLEHLASKNEVKTYRPPSDLQDTIRVVVRLCQLRAFRTRLFPRTCLRQSIVLFRLLGRLGYPVRIHFGVRKQGVQLKGHSWVTLNGEPLAERIPLQSFAAVYSYPVTREDGGERPRKKSLLRFMEEPGT